jgi:nitrile hydratase accessory protein
VSGAEVSAADVTVDGRVRDLGGAVAPPRSNGELVFAAPWEGRAFGMALVVVDRLGLDWDEFRQRLIAAIADDPARPYYESWSAALEALVTDLGVVDAVELERLATT